MDYAPTVLLVEDDPNDAKLFRAALGKCRVAVNLKHVPSGADAIRYLKGEGTFADRNEHPLPGLVVLDLHVPGVDGLALLRWIRKQTWLQGLPVVMCTGTELGKSLEDAMRSGADTYVLKQHNCADLVSLVENADLHWGASG